MAIPKKYAVAKKKATKKKVTRKRNPAKKKRSAKQIAATKRLVALNKKRRKNPDPKKKVAKKKTVRKTNPAKRRAPRKWRVLCVVPSAAGLNKGLDPKATGYWTGAGWDTRKSKAVRFPNVQAARNTAAELPKKYRSGLYWSYATEVV